MLTGCGGLNNGGACRPTRRPCGNCGPAWGLRKPTRDSVRGRLQSARERDFAAYGPINDHGHEIPALDLTRIDPSLLRRQVAFAGPYRPGTIVVMIGERHLYFVEPGGMAMRYTWASAARRR